MKKSLVSVLAVLLAGQAAFAQLTITEGSEIIPTYLPGKPNPMPRFYDGEMHQFVQRHYYPYAFDNNLSKTKQDVEYPMIYVENEYVKFSVAPGQGGRIYDAVDKTNGYHWLYRNDVVKPALIGMNGNWRSGGLAWGYPHHHGPTTVENMEYKIQDNEDGSRTIWIYSEERLQRANNIIGYTFWPESSIVQMTIIPRNPTELTNSFQFWTVPAVLSEEDYQVCFPTSTKFVTYHEKKSMTTWPVSEGVYNYFDFTNVDISLWKNTISPVSFFVWNNQEDYFGGYDHLRQGGTAWVGNHYVSPGMKYWADGNNPNGVKINNGLTDNSGRYTELMAGFYSDNQPDYSWLQPYETKAGTMTWFPVRDLGGLKYANLNGALNYIMDGSSVDLRLNSTRKFENAQLVVSGLGKEILTRDLTISPADPFKVEVNLPEGMTELDMEFVLNSSCGEQLLRYAPAEHQKPDYEMPEIFKDPVQPDQIESVEELYLTGLRLDQFHNPYFASEPYLLAALERDPGYSPANVQLGLKALKDFNWDKAGAYFKTAYDRVTMRYTRARDCEPLYYLGIVERRKGNLKHSYDWFYRASWDQDWHSASYLQLAQIDCIRGEYDKALDHIERSISTNTENIFAQDLKGVILRKLGRADEAAAQFEATLEKAKIEHVCSYELGNLGDMVGNPQHFLELACFYIQAGQWEDAKAILERSNSSYPMIHYAIAYCEKQLGNEEAASSQVGIASKCPWEYCYPSRFEEIDFLETAMEIDPSDAKAPYYLGCLLFEHQLGRAVSLFEKSKELDPSFYIVHRNLGLACEKSEKDYKKALSYMMDAVKCNSKDYRLMFEVDRLNHLAGLTADEKYKFCKKYFNTFSLHDESLLKMVTRMVENRKYDEALNILENHVIVESENATEKQIDFITSYCLRAWDQLAKGKSSAALKTMQKALDYPMGRYARAQYAQMYWFAGTAAERCGDTSLAAQYFAQGVDIKGNAAEIRELPELKYGFYIGKCYEKIGENEKAKAVFEALGNPPAELDCANAEYEKGLAALGLGDNASAKEHLQKAYSLDNRLIFAKVWLESLK
ncbi:MAG: DUF5107 domain-containing protein [Bacteroidales bacterium]|nr:DUF5107 domain-containing protein [Bacteroidales bacterium]